MGSGTEEWWLSENVKEPKNPKNEPNNQVVGEPPVTKIIINNITGEQGNRGKLSFQEEYERRFLAEGAVPLINMKSQNSTTIIWVSWLFGGFFGVHRILLGHWFLGILYMFTAGLFFLGWMSDGFVLNQLILEGRENQRMNTHENKHWN